MVDRDGFNSEPTCDTKVAEIRIQIRNDEILKKDFVTRL